MDVTKIQVSVRVHELTKSTLSIVNLRTCLFSSTVDHRMFPHLLFLFEQSDALWAVPLPLGLVGEPHASKVEPLDGAVVVVAPDHLPIGHLLAQAVGGLVGVHRHVQHLLRHGKHPRRQRDGAGQRGDGGAAARARTALGGGGAARSAGPALFLALAPPPVLRLLSASGLLLLLALLGALLLLLFLLLGLRLTKSENGARLTIFPI